MSGPIETVVTLTIDGDEQDVRVRALVTYERLRGGSMGFAINGDIEVMVGAEWRDIDTLDIDAGDRERADDAICEAASEDDGCGRDADEFYTGEDAR